MIRVGGFLNTTLSEVLACLSPSLNESHRDSQMAMQKGCYSVYFLFLWVRSNLLRSRRRPPPAVPSASCMLRFAFRFARCVYVGVSYGGWCTCMHMVGCRLSSRLLFHPPFFLLLSLSLSLCLSLSLSFLPQPLKDSSMSK